MRLGGLARRFAAAINAPLIFCAPSVPINVTNIFKVILIRLFGLAPSVPLLLQPGEPLLIYNERSTGASQLLASEAERPTDNGAGAGVGAGAGAPPSPPPLRTNTCNTAASGGSSLTLGV